MWSLTQSLPAIFLVLGLLLVLQVRMDRNGWLQLRPQALQLLRLIALYFLVDYHAVALVPKRCHFPIDPRQADSNSPPLHHGGAAFTQFPSGRLDAASALPLRAPRLPPLAIPPFRNHSHGVVAWPLVHERVVLDLVLEAQQQSRYMPLLILTAWAPSKTSWIPTLRRRTWIAGSWLLLCWQRS